MKTILAPIDFSAVTDDVLAEASLLARSVGGQVVLLTVIQPPTVIAEYGPLLQNIAEITAAGEKGAAMKLAKMQEKLCSEFIACETIQLVGAPTAHILAEAERLDADYIVMGSHGHTALYDLLVGSTTHGVLSRAHCPVVVIPAARIRQRSKRRKKSAATV